MKRNELIQARKKKQEIRKVAAEGIGISEIYLRKIESGDMTPGRNAILKMCLYYNEPAEALFPDIFLMTSDSKAIGG